eukprot:gene11047-25887_t
MMESCHFLQGDHPLVLAWDNTPLTAEPNSTKLISEYHSTHTCHVEPIRGNEWVQLRYTRETAQLAELAWSLGDRAIQVDLNPIPAIGRAEVQAALEEMEGGSSLFWKIIAGRGKY